MKATTLVVTLLAATLLAAAPLAAKTLYLTNGDRIEYKSVWRQDGRLYVLINRDTLVDFSPKEVDMKKSFKAKKVKKAIKHKKRAPQKPLAPSPSLISGKGDPQKTAPATPPAAAPKPVPAAPQPGGK
ncbi:MAG TPA: hypothetical protein VI389_09105 [Geobacteraceae bacterium]